MSSLFIIGNGFDLVHGLPTRYKDFYNYLMKIPRKGGFITRNPRWIVHRCAQSFYECSYLLAEAFLCFHDDAISSL